MNPELLSPAGTIKSMQFAFAYGADAVYAGQPRYSLRVRNNEFNKLENLEKAINIAHSQGKQFYLATNLSPHNDKIRSFVRDMEPIIAMKPDALIMSDPGLIMLIRENWPDQEIHLSVQSNAVNWATVKFWQQQGLSRVILSRELSIEEIGEIKQKVPEMELEVFVHGALCIAYSGRCLLSGYMTHRDSNQGACTNSCRWKYDAHEAKETPEGDIVAVNPPVENWQPEQQNQGKLGQAEEIENKIFLLQEEGRPGEYMPAYEDEHGTYIMNSKDLRAIQHMNKLYKMGVDSFKIEGRTKSHFYVARTAQLYREALDDAIAGNDFNMQLMDKLEGLANRGYTEGFYRRHLPAEYQNYENGNSKSLTQQFVGEILEVDKAKNQMTIDVKNRFVVGDDIELMTPQGNVPFKLEHIESAKNGEAMDIAPGSGHIVNIPMPIENVPEQSMLIRNLPV
ncbi:MAG: tRNA 5-hydroxyuridine modification protein YegQ [Pseudomonadales bacterium]|nr:tRNA 5-hydroxyuridine modification protein YegQ [Pseudomonadales bacterium]